jgi:hypothetical protein
MKFIVDRKTWFRGQGPRDSRLLKEGGERCCIGFVGQQCGIKNEDLMGEHVVHQVPERHKFPRWMTIVVHVGLQLEDSDIYQAYKTNDNLKITDVEREAQLKDIFRRNGDEIEFIN